MKDAEIGFARLLGVGRRCCEGGAEHNHGGPKPGRSVKHGASGAGVRTPRYTRRRIAVKQAARREPHGAFSISSVIPLRMQMPTARVFIDWGIRFQNSFAFSTLGRLHATMKLFSAYAGSCLQFHAAS